MDISEVNPDGNVYQLKDSAARAGLAQIAAQNIYSTTETDTGKKWIDGKPIYRRVVTGTYNVKAQDYTTLIPIEDLTFVDTMVDIRGFHIIQTNLQTFIPNANTGLDWHAGGASPGVLIFSQNVIANDKITIWIEYTKTTD